MKARKLRILYSSGPVDATSVYMNWATGRDDPAHFCIIYAQQFFELCHSIGAKALLISCRNKRSYIRDGQFDVLYRPLLYKKSHPLYFHLRKFLSGLILIASALFFRADVVIATQDRTYWFLLSILPALGIKVIPTIHCTMWTKYENTSALNRFIHKLDGFFFRNCCPGICVVSATIKDQVLQITQGRSRPIHVFIPKYRKSRFEVIDEPRASRQTFRVLYVGRIQENKGVYQLLEIAKEISADHPNIVFELCGEGSALMDLQKQAAQANLNDQFVCHGFCQQAKLKQLYSTCSIVVVPTTTGFIEGFNKVVLEGVLFGRPVVTSSACPALYSVQEAVVEVAADSTPGYRDAILRLANEQTYYEEKRRKALDIRQAFFEHEQSWMEKVKHVLAEVT